MENRIILPEGTVIPDPIQINGYLISAGHVQTAEGVQLYASIEPTPESKEIYEQICKYLAGKLFVAIITINALRLENKKMKDNFFNFLIEKDRLEKEVRELKGQIEELLNNNRSLSERLEKVEIENSDLKIHLRIAHEENEKQKDIIREQGFKIETLESTVRAQGVKISEFDALMPEIRRLLRRELNQGEAI